MDLTIIIPTFNEKENIEGLIPEVVEIVSGLTEDFEIIVVDAGSTDGTQEAVLRQNVRFINQRIPGYGGALKEGFKVANGSYIITLDADYSHKPLYIKNLWEYRNEAELIIASRYVKGGKAQMPFFRKILSILLNRGYTWILQMPYRDISSGFRIYNRKIFEEIDLVANGFSMLEELLVKVHCNGWRILESPFEYSPRKAGRSNAKLIKFAYSFLITLLNMWRLRNSIFAADYDFGAFYSRILPQRLWQRKRYKVIMDFLDGKDHILDIGCGSSKIIKDLPEAIGVDINHKALRYLSNGNHRVVEADLSNLPFKSSSFKTVICSEVIEHLSKEKFRLDELEHVLEKDGVLILGTPDYNRESWCIVEWFYRKLMPWGYADQHISHYTFPELKTLLEKRDWQVINWRYVYGMEMIIKVRNKERSI